MRRSRTAWLFLTPVLVALCLVAAWPLARTIWFSFTDAALLDLGAAQFTGLDNYLARDQGEWTGAGPVACNLTLLILGTLSYVGSLFVFCQRDLPAPL